MTPNLPRRAALCAVIAAITLAGCRQAVPLATGTPTANPIVSGPEPVATAVPANDAAPPAPVDAPPAAATEPAAAGADQATANAVPKSLPKSVNINASALSDKVAATTLPAVDLDPGTPGFAAGLPAHVRISFGGDQLITDYVDVKQRQILVIPVQDYLDKFASDPDTQKTLAAQIATLQEQVKARTTKSNDQIPILPPVNAAQVFRSKVKYINFKGGSGVRFLTAYAQDVLPVTNADIFYTFQGITNDGKYYVAAYMPITTKVLSESREKVTQKELDESLKDVDGYLKRITTAIEKQPSNGYTPNLDAIDGVISSLELKSGDEAVTAEPAAAAATPDATAIPGVAVIDPKPAGAATVAPGADATVQPGAVAGDAQNGRATEVLNVRASASTRSRIVAVLKRGQTVSVIGRNAKADWFRVQVGRRQGWVFAEYVSGVDVNKLTLID